MAPYMKGTGAVSADWRSLHGAPLQVRDSPNGRMGSFGALSVPQDNLSALPAIALPPKYADRVLVQDCQQHSLFLTWA